MSDEETRYGPKIGITGELRRECFRCGIFLPEGEMMRQDGGWVCPRHFHEPTHSYIMARTVIPPDDEPEPELGMEYSQ